MSTATITVPEFTIEDIENAISNNSHDSGMSASFVRINDEWGFKFYESEWARDETHQLQSMAYEIDCAPAIGEKIDIDGDGMVIYGYITQIANVFIGGGIDEDGWYADEDDFEEVMSINDFLELKQVLDKCKNELVEITDIHGGNFGRLKNGRIVIIDFSHHS